MAQISWVKLKTDMFDNEKIKLIESLPEADTIIVIWVKLISYAGKVNSNGYIMLTENIPMNIEEISTIFGRPLNTVRLALETFKRYGMVTMEGEMIRIRNWEEHQNVDGMERIKTLQNERQRKHREKKKLELPVPKEQSHVTVTLHHATDIDLELDKDKTLVDSVESRFNKLWSLYPRKEGKKKALASYKRVAKKENIDELIKNAILEYSKVTDPNYYKHGSTWFNGEHWNDEITGFASNNKQPGQAANYKPFEFGNLEE